jgi:5-formyltetrahydrofolate cyclo-ligase
MVINNNLTDHSTAQLRTQIRKDIRTARRNLSDEQQHTDANKLFHRLIEHSQVNTAQHIGITLASDGEIDTLKFIKWCWANNKQTYLPVIDPIKKGYLIFLKYAHDTEMVLNRYGINEPKRSTSDSCAISQLDIVFTPLVGFDLQGNRIGMGGGYYDRMLSPWFKEKKGPYPIGLAHDCQQVETLPIEEWDVPLPEIITPNQHYYW